MTDMGRENLPLWEEHEIGSHFFLHQFFLLRSLSAIVPETTLQVEI